MYYASRTLYSNKVCNGTSSNWKADWARLTGKSYAQVASSNLTKAKVKSPHISRNTVISLANKINAYKARSSEFQLPLQNRFESIHDETSDKFATNNENKIELNKQSDGSQ